MLARRLLARDVYDCFVLVDDGIATVQRALWDSFDTAHPRYMADHPFAGTIGSFYRFVDDQIGDLLELVDDDTIVAIVSACGAQALHSEIALNEWLLATGELVLMGVPDVPTTLERCTVDWEHTRAWAGDAGAIYLNVAGREPQGTVPADQIEQAGASIAERLRALAGPDGAPGAVEVYRPGALYAATNGVAPDLIALCTRPGWRPTAALGYGETWIGALDARLEAACESPSGFLALHDPQNRDNKGQLTEATIYDIVPTLLAALEQPIPARLRGRPLLMQPGGHSSQGV
jgi:predicted AlkP superfamily phosphohydrolase/phosphomutase